MKLGICRSCGSGERLACLGNPDGPHVWTCADCTKAIYVHVAEDVFSRLHFENDVEAAREALERAGVGNS